VVVAQLAATLAAVEPRVSYAEMQRHAQPLMRRGKPSRLLEWRAAGTHPCACGCGTPVRRFDDEGTPRRWVKGHHHTKPAAEHLTVGMQLKLHPQMDRWLTDAAAQAGVSRPAFIRSLLQRAQEAPASCG